MQISVIIPVYNAAPFLDKSILSALNQSQTREVILIDDRSTDGSWEKCEEWVQKDKKIRLFRNEGIKGAGAARNLGLSNATCEFIAFLDADDYYLEGRFDDDKQLFLKLPNLLGTANTIEFKTVDFNIQTGLNAVFENGKTIGFEKSLSKVTIYDYYKGSTLHLNGLTISHNVLNKSGYFDENLKQAQDTDFLFRILLTGLVMSTNVHTVKAIYNIHNNNTISNIAEATYYRRKVAKKHFHLALNNNLRYSLIFKFFKDFVEYDYLWYFGKSHTNKKGIKLFLIPFFIFRICSKTDPEYDKDRTIHLA
jgi:glycosyltransferase involved in cell wall biosynthesis